MKETIKKMMVSKNPEGEAFRQACQESDIKPTSRQISKWLRGTGIAYKIIILKKECRLNLPYLRMKSL